jgi:hypothetical protein
MESAGEGVRLRRLRESVHKRAVEWQSEGDPSRPSNHCVQDPFLIAAAARANQHRREADSEERKGSAGTSGCCKRLTTVPQLSSAAVRLLTSHCHCALRRHSSLPHFSARHLLRAASPCAAMADLRYLAELKSKSAPSHAAERPANTVLQSRHMNHALRLTFFVLCLLLLLFYSP